MNDLERVLALAMVKPYLRAEGSKVEQVGGYARSAEVKRIEERLGIAEFGGQPRSARPDTPPEDWEKVLGEHIHPAVLAKAAASWHLESSDLPQPRKPFFEVGLGEHGEQLKRDAHDRAAMMPERKFLSRLVDQYRADRKQQEPKLPRLV